MVWLGDGAQEVIQDFLQGRLLKPDLSRGGAAPEEAGAACRFRGKRL